MEVYKSVYLFLCLKRRIYFYRVIDSKIGAGGRLFRKNKKQHSLLQIKKKRWIFIFYFCNQIWRKKKQLLFFRNWISKIGLLGNLNQKSNQNKSGQLNVFNHF
jgi:hypothetical protein